MVVFGAGPIGLGAAIGYRLSGAASVVVADVIPSRLEKALAVGADAVINSAEEDVIARLTELHGTGGTAMGYPTEIFEVTKEIAENWEHQLRPWQQSDFAVTVLLPLLRSSA